MREPPGSSASRTTLNLWRLVLIQVIMRIYVNTCGLDEGSLRCIRGQAAIVSLVVVMILGAFATGAMWQLSGYLYDETSSQNRSQRRLVMLSRQVIAVRQIPATETQ